MSRSRWWLWLLAAAAFAAVVIAAVCGFLKVRSEVSYSLDFGSLADAFALLIIGALIEFAYSKRSSEKRADTELLLELVADAKAALNGLEIAAQDFESGHALTPKQQRTLIGAERTLSNAVHSVEMGLVHCRELLERFQFDKLKHVREKLKDTLTETPFPGPYEYGRIGSIRTASKEMRDELTRMAFAVNQR